MKLALTVLAIVCQTAFGEQHLITTNAQQGHEESETNVKYAGPIVYTNEKPPMLLYPQPTLASDTKAQANAEKSFDQGKVEYVPFPFQDLPVLIYKSNTTPPVHIVDEALVAQSKDGESTQNAVDKRKGELLGSQRVAKSLSGSLSKLNGLFGLRKSAQPAPIYYQGQLPIQMYPQPMMITQEFGEQTSASEKVARYKKPATVVADINVAAASNNYDAPAAPPATASSTQYSYGGSGTSRDRERDRERSRYGYRVGSNKSPRDPVDQEPEYNRPAANNNNNYDDYDSGYGSQSQQSENNYNDNYDNNLPAPASTSAASDDYRSPASSNENTNIPAPLPPPASSAPSKYPEYERERDREPEPSRPLRPRYTRQRYRPRYPSSSSGNDWGSDSYNDWGESPSQSERSWLSSLFGGYSRWRPQKYRSPFTLGSELSLSSFPLIDSDSLNSFNFLPRPNLNPMSQMRNPGWGFNPRPMPMASNFRPAFTLGGLYGGGSGFAPPLSRPLPPPHPHHPHPSPYLSGSSLVPIVRPFNYGPPMMRSPSMSYPVKVPYMPLNPIMRSPFSPLSQLSPFGSRPLSPSDLSFAESRKRVNVTSADNTASASHSQVTVISPTLNLKPVPNHLQKPPIIIYQGMKAPVQVYAPQSHQISTTTTTSSPTEAQHHGPSISYSSSVSMSSSNNNQQVGPVYIPSTTESSDFEVREENSNSNSDDSFSKGWAPVNYQ